MKFFNKLILTCGLLLNIIGSIQCQTAQKCYTNEFYYNATLSPICDANCQDLQRQCPMTSFRPVAGCYCKPNYARNLQQICIPRQRCDKDCPQNESPIAPVLRACEQLCHLSATAFPVTICYRRQERNCVCSIKHCRNRRG